MKIEFLNTWQGKLPEPLTRHLAQQAPETDVFCFQEASSELQHICEEIIPTYTKITASKNGQRGSRFEQATYIRPEIEVKDTATILDETKTGGLGIAVALKSKTEPLLHVGNVHGVAQPGDKLDTNERIQQSQVIVDFFRDKKGPRVIGGDFNLLPGTRSIQMFEETGYQNLIKDFGIQTTRNRLAWELYPDNKQYFADYVFVSKEIDVVKFSVPDIEISDHLPLRVEVTGRLP